MSPAARSFAAALLVSAVACAHDPLSDIQPDQLLLADTQGARVGLTAYRGQVVVLHFFATWCFDCLGDVPRLEALQEAHRKEGLQVVGVGLDREGAQVLEPFRTFNHLTYPILIGSDRFATPGLPFAPVTTLPTGYLIARDGRVVAHWEGLLPAATLERLIAVALAAK